jgi:hypothetical protein
VRDCGTRACYVFGPEPGGDRSKGCRCESCREANRAYCRLATKRKRRIDRGKTAPVLVDAAPVRAHLLWLLDKGIGTRVVAHETGLNRKTIKELRDGTTTRVRPARAEAILAVGTHRAHPGTLVDAKATWRLLDELLAHGFTRTELARRLGSTAKMPSLQVHRDRVTAENARKVAALHAELMAGVIANRAHMRDERARFRARARGEAA